MNIREFNEIMKKIAEINKRADMLAEEIERLKSDGQNEGHTLPTTMVCPICKEKISRQATMCPHCGHPVIVESDNEVDTFFASYDFMAVSDMVEYSDGKIDFSIVVFEPSLEEINGEVTLSVEIISLINKEYFLEVECFDSDGDSVDKDIALEIVNEGQHIELSTTASNLWGEDEVRIEYKIGHVQSKNRRKILVEGTLYFQWLYGDWEESAELILEDETVSTELVPLSEDEFDEYWGLDEYYGEAENVSEKYKNGDIESERISDSVLDVADWDSESYLRSQGYTVSQTEGLSDEERCNILKNVMDSGVLDKKDIINHLERMINLRKNSTRYQLAISKWKRDITYVQNY